jgi:hypothetical protein
MKNDQELKWELEQSLSNIAVPESLYRFVENVPDLCDQQVLAVSLDVAAKTRHRVRIMPAIAKSAAAVVILSLAFSLSVMVSPAFASYLKDVPGFDIAVSWLTQIRQEDGVQNAIDNRYTPIEPVTAKFGNTKITIADIYLTDEELMYKVYYSTDKFDVAAPDSRNFFSVVPLNLPGAEGSTARRTIIEPDGVNGKPILQETYKYVASENGVRDFLQKHDTLKLGVHLSIVNRETRSSETEEVGEISVPVDRSKLLHNKIVEPNQKLQLAASYPDLKELTLEKLTIQPTSINAIISVKNGWKFDFPVYEASSPFLRDDKGNRYPYNPGGTVRMLEDGKLQLPFSSSVFFDNSVETLYLHIGELSVYEKEPSGHFELSMNESFPKTVMFKNKQIVIQEAKYRDGYVYLRLKKDLSDPKKVHGIHFFNREYKDNTDSERMMELGKQLQSLGIPGWGTAFGFSSNKPYLEVYIPVNKKQDKYRFELQRVNDTIKVNRDYLIKLK